MVRGIVIFEVIPDVSEGFNIRGLLSWVCARNEMDTGIMVVVVTSALWPERKIPFTGLLDTHGSSFHLETRGLCVCLPEG